jgi:hypothetical protein
MGIFMSAQTTTVTRDLVAFWRAQISAMFGGYQKPLTTREVGQLKQLDKYLGLQCRPVIRYALEHWGRFASRAGAEAGVAWPVSPHVGFLLKHHAVAVNLMMETSNRAESPPQQLNYAVLPLPLPEPEEPHRLTVEELAEMLAGLE